MQKLERLLSNPTLQWCAIVITAWLVAFGGAYILNGVWS